MTNTQKSQMIILITLSLISTTVLTQSCGVPFQCNTDFVVQDNTLTTCVSPLYYPYPPGALNINSCGPNYSCYSAQLSSANPFTTSSVHFELNDGQCVLNPCQPQVQENQGFCYNNGDCVTNFCNQTTNICQTLSLEQVCLMGKSQCGKGLICFNANQGSSSGVCQNILQANANCSTNASANNSYLLCATGTACAYNDATQKSGPFCLQAFSQPANGFVSLIADPNQPLTASMLCETYEVNSTNFCLSTPQTLKSAVRNCTNDLNCVSNLGTTGTCSCDNPNSNGLAYCQGFYGDSVYTSIFTVFQNQVQSYLQNISSCSMYQYQQSSSGCVMPNSTATVQAYGFQNVNFAGIDNGLEAFDIPNFGSGDGAPVGGKCPVYMIESVSSTSFTKCRFFNQSTNTVHLAKCLSQYACQNQFEYPTEPEPTINCSGIQVSQKNPSGKAQTAVKRVLASANPTSNFQSTLYCYRNGPLGTQSANQTTGYPIGNFLTVSDSCVAAQNTAGNQWQTDCITNTCGNVNNGVGTCIVLPSGANCTSSVQCDKGLLCNIGQTQPQCQAMLKIGGSCDNQTFSLCPPNSQCALLYNSSQPYTFSCQNLYSVPGGSAFELILANNNEIGQQGIIVTPPNAPASQYQNAFNQLCQTGTFDYNSQTCYVDYEKTELTSGQLFPPTCTQDIDCQSTYSSTSTCSCTPNTQGLQFCLGSFGDYEYNIIQFNQYINQIQNTDYTQIYPYQALLPNATVMNINNIANLNDFAINMPYKWTNFTNVPVEYQGNCYNSINSFQFPNHFLPFSLQVTSSIQDLRQNVDQLPYNLTSFKPYPNMTCNCTKYQCKSDIANETTAACMSINTEYNHSLGNIGNLEIDVLQCIYTYSCYSSHVAQNNDLFLTSNSTNPALGYYAYEGQCILNNNQAKRTPADQQESSSSTWCYRDSDCLTNTCINNTCMLKKQNDACDLQLAQCGANMTCFLSKCTNILLPGATCSDNLDSTNYQLCPQGTICVNFTTNSKAQPTITCQQLFSLPVNSTNIKIIGQYTLPVQYLCEYGQLQDSTCIYPDQTKNGFPFACTSNQDCVGVNGTQGQCNCDTPTQDGQAYCKGFPGDAPYSTLINNTRKAIQNYLKKSQQCAEYMQLPQYTGNMKKQCKVVDLSNFTTETQNGYVSGPAVPQCLINAGINFPTQDGNIFQGNFTFPTTLCPAYACNQQLINDSQNTYCRYQDDTLQNYSNQWYLAACPENYECSPYSGKLNYKYCVKNGPYDDKIIPYGGLCSLLNNVNQSSFDCLTKLCLPQETNYQGYGICGVWQIHQNCTNDTQCGKGMKCFSYLNNYSQPMQTCEYTIKIGGECNLATYNLCPHQSACIMQQYYVYDYSTTYTCQQYYSQPNNANFSMIINGQIVRQPVDDQNLSNKYLFDQMCQSGSFNSSLLSCNPYLEYSINVPPIQCQSDADCMGIWGSKGSCECFPNTEGYKYCKLFPGDLQLYINYFNKLVTYSQQNFSNCLPIEYMYPGQGKNSSNGGCYAQSADSYFAQLQQVYTPVDPQYVPGCIKSQFWNYGFQSFQYSHAAKLLISSIFVIILTFIVLFI